MKKVFLFIAAAALTLAACQKQQYVIPVDNGEDENTDPSGEEGYKEQTFVVNVEMIKDVNTNYSGVVAEMPGDDILDFFGLTAEEFYAGFGSINGSGTGGEADLQRSQENNTIMFGVANANNTDELKWNPATSGDCGQFFKKDGSVTYWSDTESWFFIENHNSWGEDAPDAETLEEMWVWTIGIREGNYDNSLGTLKATQVFFYTDDDDVELYAYVQWNINIVEGEDVTLNVVGTQEINLETPYIPGYAHTSLVSEINGDAIQSAIGLSIDEATSYGVNADGSFTKAPGVNFWFSVDGDVIGWQTEGGKNGICINSNETEEWAWCMYPYEGLAGQTLKGAIAFVNPDTNNAYVVKVTVSVESIDYLVINQLVSYEDGETEYTLTENNLAALAAALGVESVSAEEIGTTYPLKGINADGSAYEGDFTANNGYWYTLAGNVSNWGEIEAAGYAGAYLEYRGDYTFGCGLWEETGVTSTVKIGIGDAVLTFNLEVDEAKSFETEEAGVLAKSTSQAVSAGYRGGVLEITEEEVAALIEGTPDDWYVLNTEGNMDYTANGGYWYNADGEVCEYADGAFFIEPGEAFPSMNTGIHPDNVTAAATFTGSFRIANPESGKHVTVNATITVTE